MAAVQSHGFSFEKWVRDTLFNEYSGHNTQKWDIPPEFNQHPTLPHDFRNIPVSVKTAKVGSPIGLGDILRQRRISEPFLMIVGFWRQRTPSEKWFEDIGWVKFTPSIWNGLWGSLSLTQISEIDQVVKDRNTHYTIAREKAQHLKRLASGTSGNQIVINPKIDSKKQRRIQCSLPFNVFWTCSGRSLINQDCPELFGFPFKNPIISSSRSFNQD